MIFRIRYFGILGSLLFFISYCANNTNDCNQSIVKNHIDNSEKAHTVETGVSLLDIQNKQEKTYRLSDGKVSPQTTDHSHTLEFLSNHFTDLQNEKTITINSSSYNFDNHQHQVVTECNINNTTGITATN